MGVRPGDVGPMKPRPIILPNAVITYAQARELWPEAFEATGWEESDLFYIWNGELWGDTGHEWVKWGRPTSEAYEQQGLSERTWYFPDPSEEPPPEL